MPPHHWLFKSEPSSYSIDDLEKEGIACWDGVRNYQARNRMRDEVKVGDKVLFYHSNASPPGAVGVATVCRNAYADHTSWDKKSPYYDPKSSEEAPRWFMVDIQFEQKFSVMVSLAEMKEHEELSEMVLLRKGNRLSITPVTEEEFNYIVALGQKESTEDE